MINKPIFFEEGHKYINPKTKEEYISVTTLLHKFEPVKDWTEIATKYVKARTEERLIEELTEKYSISKESLLAFFKTLGKVETVKHLWKLKNQQACEAGTELHLEKEKETLSQEEHFIAEGVFLPLGIDATNVEDLYQLPDGIYTELLVWDNFLAIAGQADKVIIQTINNIRYVDIEDYKTNEEIKQWNYIDRNNKKIINENLLFPLDHLCNCNYWLYQLQLNMYGWLLEQFGFKFRGGKIIHVKDDNKEYDLLNLQNEINNIITVYQDAKRNNRKTS